MDVSKQVIIRTVEIAGVNIAVALADELARAKAVHAALLRGAAKVQAHPVVKLANADISALFVVRCIQFKYIAKEISVFAFRHKQIVFSLITERFQAGDKLYVLKPFAFKKTVDLFSALCRITC